LRKDRLRSIGIVQIAQCTFFIGIGPFLKKGGGGILRPALLFKKMATQPRLAPSPDGCGLLFLLLIYQLVINPAFHYRLTAANC
jgi:hypothetical protein